MENLLKSSKTITTFKERGGEKSAVGKEGGEKGKAHEICVCSCLLKEQDCWISQTVHFVIFLRRENNSKLAKIVTV